MILVILTHDLFKIEMTASIEFLRQVFAMCSATLLSTTNARQRNSNERKFVIACFRHWEPVGYQLISLIEARYEVNE